MISSGDVRLMSEPTVNTEGILASMKLMLGMEPDYNAFDTDLIIHITHVWRSFYQVGVGSDHSSWI
jgi:hypothetical protein